MSETRTLTSVYEACEILQCVPAQFEAAVEELRLRPALKVDKLVFYDGEALERVADALRRRRKD